MNLYEMEKDNIKEQEGEKVFKSLFPVQILLSQGLLGTTEFASKPQHSKRGKS